MPSKACQQISSFLRLCVAMLAVAQVAVYVFVILTKRVGLLLKGGAPVPFP